ncbi:hypothetical protein [Tsukamurella tyrosinosolvens]|uniref:hypothetical protein n=1 Tax=Tsukamurella tyrosinosolvens TaxID=57704 RepID=UPI002DD44F36|nr:hypothetical protein [Tsukamurella tyrosinosolvens]MEC4614573.1 hypothetical protein [Tsukamurella tyrosinosolvens]
MIHVSTADLDRHARTLGVNLTYPAEVTRLTAAAEHARTYEPPHAEPLGRILIDTEPSKWTAAIKAYAALDSQPSTRTIRESVLRFAEPDITNALRNNADEIIAQVHQSAADAANIVIDAATAGITDLTDYEYAARMGIAPKLIDAQHAIKKLNAFTNLLTDLTIANSHGAEWLDIGTLIELPDNLAPRPVAVAHTTFADLRYSVGTAVSQASPEAEQAWNHNRELKHLSRDSRILTVATGRFEGFQLKPAATIAEAHARADKAAEAQRDQVQ